MCVVCVGVLMQGIQLAAAQKRTAEGSTLNHSPARGHVSLASSSLCCPRIVGSQRADVEKQTKQLSAKKMTSIPSQVPFSENMLVSFSGTESLGEKAGRKPRKAHLRYE